MTKPGIAIWHPATMISTWFGVGFLRPAPGTWGTIAALPFAWLIHAHLGLFTLLVGTMVAYGLGIWCAEIYSRATNSHDASEIVIDEVAGVWLALCFAPISLLGYITAAALFRFFDILKPWPIGWADKKLPGGFGIMTDDMIAGLAAGLITYSLHWQGLLPDVSF